MTEEKINIRLTVNGQVVEARVEARLTLADFLRGHLRLTGTHLGCEHGVCGACTILVGGEAMRSCILFAAQADGESITTVEGLSPEGTLNRLQTAFRRNHALQCGFCTSGMLMSATSLLSRCPSPTPEQVRDGLSGNLCRCTGYIPIVNAVVEASQPSRKE